MYIKKIVIIPILFAVCACSNDGKNYYTFRHQQGHSDYNDYFYYEDSIFDQDSTTFNIPLATASISFAMASFASMSIEKYENKSDNAKDFFAKIGFTDFAINDWYKKKPEADSIGLVAAQKKIGDYTVVAIGLRGANYTSEWASNITIGNREDGYHEGFVTAANNYIAFANDYFQTKNITGNVKIWTAGYSRAGAVCNLASGILCDQLNQGQKPFGDSVNLTRNHFYSYCFEASQGAPSTRDVNDNIIVRSEKFNNIFNLLNVNDPVPMVAMKELGFTRYGIDLYYPDPLTLLDYQSHFKNMNFLYERVDNHSVLGDYRIFDFKYKGNAVTHSMSQGLFLNEFFDDLVNQGMSHMGTIPEDQILDRYAEDVQTGLRNIFKVIYESSYFKGSLMDIGISMVSDLGIINEVDYLISDLTIEGPSAFIKDIKPIIARGLNKLAMDINVKQTVDNIGAFAEILGFTLFPSLLNGKSYQIMNFVNVDNVKSLASGHYPELAAAHIRAMDKQYVSHPFTDISKMTGQYYCLVVEDINNPIVIKHGNDVIVNINNGNEIDNRISYIKRKTGYEIYLPYFEKYEVNISKDVTYTISEWDPIVQQYVFLDSGTSEAFTVVNK